MVGTLAVQCACDRRFHCFNVSMSSCRSAIVLHFHIIRKRHARTHSRILRCQRWFNYRANTNDQPSSAVCVWSANSRPTHTLETRLDRKTRAASRYYCDVIFSFTCKSTTTSTMVEHARHRATQLALLGALFANVERQTHRAHKSNLCHRARRMATSTSFAICHIWKHVSCVCVCACVHACRCFARGNLKSTHE